MKNIIIIDDDIFTKISDVPHCEFFSLLSDEDNDVFKKTQDYLFKTETFYFRITKEIETG